jgi:mitochondrial chaperone BCS1
MASPQPKAGASQFPLRHSCRLIASFAISDSLLFATTNHIERLDPALSRPGRMDVWVNFTNATKWQAEGIFKCFFPSRPSELSPSSSNESTSVDASQKNPPGSKRKASAHAVPILDEAEIARLAKRFADAIPEGEMSVWIGFIIHSPGVSSHA